MSVAIPFDVWTPVTDCDGAPDRIVVQQKTLSLYYVAIAGQTLFSLSAADLFGQTYVMTTSTALAVTRNGSRVAPDDGSGVGGYTASTNANAVTLLWPAGAGEIIIIDLFWEVEPAPPPPALTQTIGQDVLAITTINILPPLSRAPDGKVLVLFVNGRPFFATVPSPAFTYAGNVISWISSTDTVPVGAEVVAVYTS